MGLGVAGAPHGITSRWKWPPARASPAARPLLPCDEEERRSPGRSPMIVHERKLGRTREARVSASALRAQPRPRYVLLAILASESHSLLRTALTVYDDVNVQTYCIQYLAPSPVWRLATCSVWNCVEAKLALAVVTMLGGCDDLPPRSARLSAFWNTSFSLHPSIVLEYRLVSSPTSAHCSDLADLCRHRSSQTKCLLSGAQDRAALSTSNTDHANLARPEPSTVRPPPSDNHLSRLRSTGTRPRASPRTIVFDPTQQMTQVAAGPGDQRHNTLHAVGRRCYAIEPHEFVLAAGARHDRIVGSCLQPFSPGTRDPAVRRGGLVRSIPVSVLRSLFFVPVGCFC